MSDEATSSEVESNAIIAEMRGIIAKIRKSGETRRTDIQKVALAAVKHSIVHGNIVLGVELYNALNNADRRDSLVAYLETYGNFAWMKGEKTFKFFQSMTRVDGVQVPLAWTDDYAAKVAGVHWTAAKKEAEPVSVHDVEESFRKFMDRIKKAQKDGATIKHEELYLALNRTFTQYVSEAATKETATQS